MQLFGLIGYPLTHSFSKKYFTSKFEKEGIKDCQYDLYEIKDINDFPSIIKSHPGLRGLNVTIPHKEAVMKFLDELDEPVKKIKAVNVIKIRNGKLIGYNSDFHGFKISLQKFLSGGNAPKDLKALVLGTGGASKAVKAALEDLNITYKTVSRTEGQADITYEELPEFIDTHKLIVNTSPVGMYPAIDQCPAIPYEKLDSGHFLYDLVYNPEVTLFLKKGAEKGARTKNGIDMLYLQAEKAWEIWTK
jgi:shikimate dehydrogenase